MNAHPHPIAPEEPGEPPRSFERGEPVTGIQVAPYALDGHTKCHGSGFVRRAGKPTRVCTCAQKRFMKAHPEVLIDSAGAAWWPKKKEGSSTP